jgi:hypothetical protein
VSRKPINPEPQTPQIIDPKSTYAVMAWLTIVGAMIVLSASMRVESGSIVMLPLVDYPLPELCNFRRLFNTACPGCGMTRSFIHAANFRVGDAWAMNPAGTLLFLSLVASIPLRIMQWLRARYGKPLASTVRLEGGWLILLTVVMLVNWCLKL